MVNGAPARTSGTRISRIDTDFVAANASQGEARGEVGDDSPLPSVWVCLCTPTPPHDGNRALAHRTCTRHLGEVARRWWVRARLPRSSGSPFRSDHVACAALRYAPTMTSQQGSPCGCPASLYMDRLCIVELCLACRVHGGERNDNEGWHVPPCPYEAACCSSSAYASISSSVVA